MSTSSDYRFLTGVGGIGTGMFFALEGDHTLGRNESRLARRLDRRDFCKLHIIAHYVAVFTGRGRRGFAVYPIGKVGRDAAGEALLADMRACGMDTRHVEAVAGKPTLTSVCFTYPDGDGGNLTTCDSASAAVGEADVLAALAALPHGPAIALAAPEAPLAARRRLLAEARRRGWLTAASVATGEVGEALSGGLFADVDLLSVNRDEAAALGGVAAEVDLESLAAAAGGALAAANPRLRLCVTGGARGAAGWEAGRTEFVPTAPVEVVNTAGAGDAMLAGLIVATAAGLPWIRPDRPRRTRLSDAPLETALELAALLAALSVTSADTINFAADAAAVAALAERIGADATGLAPALNWPRRVTP